MISTRERLSAQNFDYSAARRVALFKTLTIEYVFHAFPPETREKLLYTSKYEREVTLYLKFCTKKVKCLPKVKILSIQGSDKPSFVHLVEIVKFFKKNVFMAR